MCCNITQYVSNNQTNCVKIKQNISTMDKRIMLDLIKEHANIKNNTSLAKLLGVTSQAVSNWYSRNTFDPELIYSKFPFINPAWLLTGEGEMILPTLNKDTKELPVAHHTDSNEGIPLIPINAMAGAFTEDQQIMEYECERFIIPTFKGADFLIGVKGTSMYPRFNSGDIVACKRLNLQDLFFQWNKVYVLDTDQGPLIKRIKPGTDKDHVTIVSDNKEYEPFELAIDHIYHVALVIGVIRVE